jgi:hypothetical protein
MAKHTGSVFSVDVVGMGDNASLPAYERIRVRIQAAIRSGAAVPNSRLSTRAIALRGYLKDVAFPSRHNEPVRC